MISVAMCWALIHEGKLVGSADDYAVRECLTKRALTVAAQDEDGRKITGLLCRLSSRLFPTNHPIQKEIIQSSSCLKTVSTY